MKYALLYAALLLVWLLICSASWHELSPASSHNGCDGGLCLLGIPVMLGIALVSGVVLLGVGVLGTTAIARHQRSKEQEPW